MPWTLHINNKASKSRIDKKNACANFDIVIMFSSRFAKDKANYKSDKYIVILDGFILNSTELKNAYRTKSIEDTIISAYEKNGETFMNELRGSYNGALYDKRNNLWIFFVNHYGDRPLFYHNCKDELFISSEFNEVAEYVKKSGYTYKSNQKAAYYILTFGYMIDNSTHIEGIQRLMPGDYLVFCNKTLKIKTYHRFYNTTIQNISFDEAIDKLDLEFKKSVKRVFDKDIEYGYKFHLADISGGLDSRMVSWVAHEMGYRNITNISYAQSQANEWKVALEVANTLGNDFMYMPLDKCNFIYDIDEIIGLNYGLAIYAGITGGKRFLANLNNTTFGLEMTGQLGDVVIGTFEKVKPIHTHPNFHNNKYSNKLKYEFDKKLLRNYNTNELFSIYTRGFLGALSTHLIRNKYIDVASPFLDVDFFSFCLSLPLEYRFNHKLYNAWIVRKYPNCAAIRTINYDGPIREDMTLIRIRRLIKKGPTYVFRRFLYKFGFNIIDSPASMNPVDYWYGTNIEFKEFIHSYYENNKSLILSGSQLSNDMAEMFNNGSTIDKILVLTVLGTYKFYGLCGE